jgi:hypothetical protein
MFRFYSLGTDGVKHFLFSDLYPIENQFDGSVVNIFNQIETILPETGCFMLPQFSHSEIE